MACLNISLICVNPRDNLGASPGDLLHAMYDHVGY